MADNFNRGSVRIDLRDAYDNYITDKIRFEFRNVKLATLNFKHETQVSGQSLVLNNVIAYPDGTWQVTIIPKKYRFKTVLVDVPANGQGVIDEVFFVNPSAVTPVFPPVEELQSSQPWQPLWQVINAQGSVNYNGLSDKQKAALFNLFAKMSDQKTALNVFSFVQNIFLIKPARFYAQVNKDLWGLVQQEPTKYREQPDNGSMHDFMEGWNRLSEHASFKTPEAMGNLQLTFAKNAQDKMAVDADLDDHQGIKHAFDVIKHLFSGDTDPYDIHEVLVKFQKIDPGYHFA